MDVMECLLGRRSIRSFTDRKIKREDLETIVKAGYHAPSAMNRQTWQFTVVQNKDKIESLAECLRKKLNRDRGYNFYRPDVFVLCSNDRENFLGREDCAVAIENMMLAAHSLGIGSVWINQFFEVCDDENVRRALRDAGVPDGHVVWGSIAMGYASPDAKVNPQKNSNVVKWVM